jgi:8-oxo-dGTP pyrophosphatase MutT (NUDIX family)
VRAVIVHANRILLVNAWPGGQSDLLCAPGGGVQRGSSLPDNLQREVFEETGLRIDVGAPCLVNEFHDPASAFHQVEVFFRCKIVGPVRISPDWRDRDEVVAEHHWLTRAEAAGRRIKPDALIPTAFEPLHGPSYDPLERILS